jgi:hypothetical protein
LLGSLVAPIISFKRKRILLLCVPALARQIAVGTSASPR